MTTLLHSMEPLTWNLFQPMDTLTQKECIHNILFLKYLLYKEPNACVRQRIHYYLDQLTDHLLHLLDQAEMPLEGVIRRPLFWFFPFELLAMNLVTFHQKNIDQRADLVSQKGIYLASRQEALYSYHLFYVQKLFVEVTQEIPGNDLVLIRGFINVFSLSAYLDLIDISALCRDGDGLF